MSNKSIKRLFVMVIAILLVAVFAACNNDTSVDEADENPVVAIVNGIEVFAEDINYYMRHVEHMMAMPFLNMYMDFEFDWEREYAEGITFAQEIREQAVRLAAFQATFVQEAARLGVVVTDEVRQEITAFLTEGLEMIGEEAFANWLVQEGYRDIEDAERQYNMNALLNDLIFYIVGNPTEFARFEQFLMPDVASAFIERAEEILYRINFGEDFDVLMFEYSEDPGLAEYPDGYTFTRGMMVSEFEAATLSLEIGEVSELVFTDLGGGRGFGIHIIKRVEPIEEDITWEPEEGEEVLGAKHILIQMPSPPMTLEQRMAEAVFEGLQLISEEAEIEFLPALDSVPTQTPSLGF